MSLKLECRLDVLVEQWRTCKHCGQSLDEHVTYPARSNYFQCKSELAPWVGCVYEAEDDTFCTFVNQEGYECGREAVVQLLPDGDEARCQTHSKKGPQ